MKISQAKIRKPSSSLSRTKNTTLQKDVINVFNNDKKGEYYFLKTDQLVPFHNQSRIYFDDKKINELSVTIKKHGMRQPLTVIRSSKNTGKYEIVSGERRYRAAKLIGLDKIPCIILTDQDNAEEIALIENIQREDLHPIELGRAYQKLYKSGFCKTHNELAIKLSVSRSQITEFMAFAEIDNNIAELLIQNGVSERKNLRYICSIVEPQEREKFTRSLISKNNISSGIEGSVPKNDKVVRKSNIIQFTLSGGNIELTHKPFSKLKIQEKIILKEHFLALINELSFD